MGAVIGVGFVIDTRLLRAKLAIKVATKTCLPAPEVLEQIQRIPDEVLLFLGDGVTDLVLGIWIALQLTDDACEAYWMTGFGPRMEGSHQ